MTMVVGLVLIIALFGMCILTFVLMPKRGSPAGDEGQDQPEEGILSAGSSIICAVLGLILSGLLDATILSLQPRDEVPVLLCIFFFWLGSTALLIGGVMLGVAASCRWGPIVAAICGLVLLANIVFLIYGLGIYGLGQFG